MRWLSRLTVTGCGRKSKAPPSQKARERGTLGFRGEIQRPGQLALEHYNFHRPHGSLGYAPPISRAAPAGTTS